MSGWTDERVKTLKDMWKLGKTSTEIAEALGGVTRNAVIGKAHRLGLSGQQNTQKKSSKKADSSAAKTAKKTEVKASKAKKSKVTTSEKTSAKATRIKKAAKVTKPTQAAGQEDPIIPEQPIEKISRRMAQEAAVPKQIDPVEITAMDQKKLEDGNVISILELTERVCRWPLGDPKKGLFGFCGESSIDGQPYCAEHMAMAFQKSKRKKSTVTKEERLEALREKAKVADEDIENVDIDIDIDNDDIEDIDLETIDDIDEDKVGMGDIEEEAV